MAPKIKRPFVSLLLLTKLSERSECSGVRLYTDNFKKNSICPFFIRSSVPLLSFSLSNHWTDFNQTLHTPKSVLKHYDLKCPLGRQIYSTLSPKKLDFSSTIFAGLASLKLAALEGVR